MREILTLLNPLRRRVMLMIGRAVLRLTDDARKMQVLQIDALSDETLDRVERFQNYGFTSHAHRGAEGLVLAIGGNRSHPAVVALDDRRHRLTDLAEGEVAMYASAGQFIRMKADGSIHIFAPGGIHIETPEGLELAARTIENHAQVLFEHSTNGYGQQWIYDLGSDTWFTDAWTDDARVVPGTTHPVHPPEIP